MIPAGAQIFIAVEPIDMRYSFDRLSGLARERVGYDVEGGALFIFFGRRRDTVKVLFCDATGLCVFYKRLHRGRFTLPPLPPGRPTWRSQTTCSTRCSTGSRSP